MSGARLPFGKVPGWLAMAPEDTSSMSWAEMEDHTRSSNRIEQAERALVVTWLLMGQSLASEESVEAPRSSAKHIARIDPNLLTAVRYVRLRHHAVPQQAGPEDGAGGRGYRHRWIVRGTGATSTTPPGRRTGRSGSTSTSRARTGRRSSTRRSWSTSSGGEALRACGLPWGAGRRARPCPLRPGTWPERGPLGQGRRHNPRGGGGVPHTVHTATGLVRTLEACTNQPIGICRPGVIGGPRVAGRCTSPCPSTPQPDPQARSRRAPRRPYGPGSPCPGST